MDKRGWTLALDIEHTLIHDVDNRIPRRGLREFLEWAGEGFGRVVVFSSLSEDVGREIMRELVGHGHAPAWFAETAYCRADFVPDDLWDEESAEIMCKDLRRVGDGKHVLLVDDSRGMCLRGQESQFVQIAFMTDGQDDELSRVRQELERRMVRGVA